LERRKPPVGHGTMGGAGPRHDGRHARGVRAVSDGAGGHVPSQRTTRPANHAIGSAAISMTATPRGGRGMARTSQCTCASREMVPTRAPARTMSPTFGTCASGATCANTWYAPSSSATTTTAGPYPRHPGVASASRTTPTTRPSAGAITGVPGGAAMSTPACHRAPSERGAIHARRPVTGAYRSTGGRRLLIAFHRSRKMLDGGPKCAQFAAHHRYRRQRDNDATGIAHHRDDIGRHNGLHRTAEQNDERSGAYCDTFEESVTTQPNWNTRPSGP